MYKAADSISFLNWLNPVCFLIKILSDKTLYSQILYESHRKKKSTGKFWELFYQILNTLQVMNHINDKILVYAI